MSNYYSPLHQEALLHIAGPDSLKFLQGQVTCDTRLVAPERAVPGAYCTPQGRVVCDFLLCQMTDDHFALRMRQDIRTSSAEVFAKYIIFSKAELDPANDEWRVFGCWGDGAAEKLKAQFGRIPQGLYGAVGDESFLLVQMDQAGQRFECYLHESILPGAVQELAQNFAEVDEPNWQSLDIEAGFARIEAATREEFVPQMLNYDLTGHVSFDKGCYTGQEVVARLHYRGTPKRRLYPIELPADSKAKPGDPLFAAQGEQSIGNLVNIASDANRIARGLVVATVAKVEDGVFLEGARTNAIALGSPPYSLTPED